MNVYIVVYNTDYEASHIFIIAASSELEAIGVVHSQYALGSYDSMESHALDLVRHPDTVPAILWTNCSDCYKKKGLTSTY